MRVHSMLRSAAGLSGGRDFLVRPIVASIFTVLAFTASTAGAQVVTANPILFVTQTPAAGFGSVAAVFGNHQPSIDAAPRGGDLMLRYPDGTLRSLTAEAGYGNSGMQGASSIAVREPCVHWNGQKALFSMIVGAATQQYQSPTARWQIYEVTGLGVGQVASIRKISGQPGYNNVSPIYATDGRILFTSDRPRGGEAHLYPQRDEYESSPIVSGIYALDEQAGTYELLEHSPSGSTSLSLDTFGRVIFTKWDHLQRDQQGDAPGVVASYQSFTYASEAANAAKTQVLAGAEVYPEPRSTQDPAYSSSTSLHTFNQFFPWEINQDGTAEETLNHVGRQEFGGAYTEGSFPADPNLTYYTSDSLHANTLKIGGDGGLFHLREDPNVPGDFLATNAPEFSTASGGKLMRITGAPSINPESMLLIAVTPTANVPQATGYFRNPLPMTDGKIIAVHTDATGAAANLGSTTAPNWNYAYRLKLLQTSGATMVAGPTLTNGITKTLSWWTPDQMASWTGTMWELDPVEVVARPVPTARVSVLPAIEAGVFAAEGVNVAEFRQYLRDNSLALVVSRNVTQRDRADVQQPFNLSVPGGVQSIGKSGTVYDISYMQFFQADALRGYGPIATPNAGRRLLARPMHEPGVSQAPGAPSGGVVIAADGSMAALVPAKRALSWQLTDDLGTPVVRERNWLSFQSGEIRVCANCHGINTKSQTGAPAPVNEPQALHDLLAAWSGGGGGGTTTTTLPGGGGGSTTTTLPDGGGDGSCTSGIALENASLKAAAAPMSVKFHADALLDTPWTVDPATSGAHIVIDGLLDATIPGGAGWTTKASGWIYRNSLGAVSGVTSVKIRNRSMVEDGRIAIKVRASGPPSTLPSASGLGAMVVFGAADECASIAWNGPGGAAPHCEGDTDRLACR